MNDCTTESPEVPLKRCAKCEQWLPATPQYFHRNKQKKSGFRQPCRKCRSRNGETGYDPIPLPPPPGYRRCPCCQKEFPATVDYFRKQSATKDGFASRCKVCALEKDKEYRIASKRQRSERFRLYREKNRNRLIESKRKWNKKNREHARQYARDNKESANSSKRRRRALARNGEGSHTAADVKRQYKSQKGFCYYCGVKVGEKYHVDHVVPLTRGGSNAPDNLVVACPHCNQSKGTKLLSEWPEGNRLL